MNSRKANPASRSAMRSRAAQTLLAGSAQAIQSGAAALSLTEIQREVQAIRRDGSPATAPTPLRLVAPGKIVAPGRSRLFQESPAMRPMLVLESQRAAIREVVGRFPVANPRVFGSASICALLPIHDRAQQARAEGCCGLVQCLTSLSRCYAGYPKSLIRSAVVILSGIAAKLLAIAALFAASLSILSSTVSLQISFDTNTFFF